MGYTINQGKKYILTMIDSYITSRPELFVLEQGGEVYGWADRPVELPCRVNQLAGRNVNKLI